MLSFRKLFFSIEGLKGHKNDAVTGKIECMEKSEEIIINLEKE